MSHLKRRLVAVMQVKSYLQENLGLPPGLVRAIQFYSHLRPLQAVDTLLVSTNYKLIEHACLVEMSREEFFVEVAAFDKALPSVLYWLVFHDSE